MPPTAGTRPLWRHLYVQVIAAVLAGVLLGYFAPDTGAAMKPLTDAFIRLVKMIIAPVIFCTVVIGIAGMEDMKKVGRAGLYALLYFEAVSTLALVVGLVMVNVLRPGAGMHVDPASLDSSAVAAYAAPGRMGTVAEFLVNLIPATVVGAFAQGEILQVLVFSLLFGFALHAIGGRGTVIFEFIEGLSRVLFGIVNIIMRFAPFGAFGAMAVTIGKYGLRSLASLGWLMGAFYGTCLIFVFVVLGTIAALTGFSLWRYLRYIREELLIVLATSSSEAALPRLMSRMQELGASPAITGLVIPTGYSFNLDGTAIYLTLAAVFIAQATDTPLDLAEQLALLAILLITSKGAAGVTGSGFIVLAATLSATGKVPLAGLVLIFGIDRFMSEARAITNIIGNGVATLVVARWCGELDAGRLRAELK
jgi:aerobic C4-dicarboxylate transport protein